MAVEATPPASVSTAVSNFVTVKKFIAHSPPKEQHCLVNTVNIPSLVFKCMCSSLYRTSEDRESLRGSFLWTKSTIWAQQFLPFQYILHSRLQICADSYNTLHWRFDRLQASQESYPNPYLRTWCHWIESWNWSCVQIVMFTGMQWYFDKRFAQFPNLASPETSTIDKILTLSHPSTCVYCNYSSIMTQDLLHLTILNNLHSCQH